MMITVISVVGDARGLFTVSHIRFETVQEW